MCVTAASVLPVFPPPWIRSFQKVPFCSSVGKRFRVAIYSRFHKVSFFDTAISGDAHWGQQQEFGFSCHELGHSTNPEDKSWEKKKRVRIEKKCLALISRVSLCQHFLSMILILKHWGMAFIMRKKCPHPPNINASVSIIWVLRNTIFSFKEKMVRVMVGILRKILNLFLVLKSAGRNSLLESRFAL